jgi:hypothetical protein
VSYELFGRLRVAPLHVASLSDSDDDGGEGSDADEADEETRQARRCFQGPVERPARGLTLDERARYNALLRDAQGGLGRAPPSPEARLRAYLAALDLCDEDPVLHGKVRG